jgi:hypothetical protein
MTLTATRPNSCLAAVLTEQALSAPTFPKRPPQAAVLTNPSWQSYDVPLSGRVMTIKLAGEAPAWLKPTIQAFRQLSQLPSGWSSYGSHSIEDAAIFRAAEVLGTLLEADSIPPTIVPTHAGGVQVEWHRNGVDIEVEFSPEGAVADVYLYDRQADRTWEPDRVTPEVYQRLRTVIAGLTRR